MRIGIAGAGFAGAVMARELADAGHDIDVFDARHHVAGNCHTERDDDTGVMVHVYGPHIFHTGHDHVWEYVLRFGQFMPYEHRVKATAGGGVYGLPVNLLTINQFFGSTMRPNEAAAFVDARSLELENQPVTFEDQALAFVGPDLYEAFFKGYTRKQWGLDPTELPASILKRLPLRFNYDDRYFDHPHVGIPADGYTPIVQWILDHPRINIHLGQHVTAADLVEFDHRFWTGPIDEYFDASHGRLGYRTLDFEVERHDGDYQGCPVMNFCDEDVPYTRVTEFKHFTPWETHSRTLTYREYSRPCGPGDIPYYPIRLVAEKTQLRQYVDLARQETGTTFLGRLGTYRYLDMDVTIHESLIGAQRFLAAVAARQPPPAFFIDPFA